MIRLHPILATIAAVLLLALPAKSQELSALARLDAAASEIADAGQGLSVTLALSQPVPWRVRLLDGPPRLLLDFREVDWSGLADMPVDAESLMGLRAGVFRPGWSRLVVELAGPMRVVMAEMVTDGTATVAVQLEPTDQTEFATLTAMPESAAWALPKAADLPTPQPKGAGPLVVVLDPGHGGLDPGAERDGRTEADLMLIFARELKEALIRDGDFAVVMTREDDVFVPLEERISIARGAGAQVFLSLHADALAEGEAVGATLYTLAEDASDEAAATLAERHDRDDLLAGVDLTEADDLVAAVLMDMARTATTPRTDRLSQELEATIKAAGLKMHRHPRQKASFSVLKSPDIPSVLLELGFLSSERDLARLEDPEWRARMTAALRDGFKVWAKADAALSALPIK